MSEVILYQTEMIEIGVFTVSPDEPSFMQQGYVDSPIIVFPKNSIWIQHEGSSPFVADATLVNFYNQGQSYQRFAINQSGDFCHWFRIEESLLSEVVAKDQQHFSRENMTCPVMVFLTHLKVLNHIAVMTQVNSLWIENQVLNMFDTLLAQPYKQDRQFSKKQNRHKHLIERVKESLHEDLSVNLSLQQLAKRHNTSPYHLSRVFKTINGEGINQYRKQQRLRHMLLELQIQHNELVDLAFDYGFSSHSHMSASFKQLFGMTPSECLQTLSNQ
ncbi:MAG: helix-turn-helix transcriptional regulator [Xanthomonadales bacterium]|nr:helix-turn-helix transcriptional regulator [Xanthomonadales bacterium]